jgi:hypothetical protein
MNKYGLPLTAPSVQTLIPAMNDAGMVFGFYEIAETTFEGDETSFALPNGTVLPLKSVQIEELLSIRNARVFEYMAAVWPAGMYTQEKPWDDEALIRVGELRNYRAYIMATHTWKTRENLGTYLTGLKNGLNTAFTPPQATTPPDAEDGSMNWSASASYEALFGDCAYFDFNWMTLFKTKSGNKDPLRINVLAQPELEAGKVPMRASIIGRPIATAAGPVYDTVRITKLQELTPKAYVFSFEVVDTANNKTPVTLTLTVV